MPTAADHLSRDQRRALGAVYTPAAEAELACRIALERWGGDPAAAVACDPACGAGDFLAALVRVRRPGRRGWSASTPTPTRCSAWRCPARSCTTATPSSPIRRGSPGACTPRPPTTWWSATRRTCGTSRSSTRSGVPGRYGDRVAAAVDRFAPDLLLSRRADLSAAFLALGVSLLAEGGVLAFVTTNAWLDAAYGAPLGRHLLDAGLCELVERPAERTFAGADVNSLIVVVRRGDDGPVALRQVGRPPRAIARAVLPRDAEVGRIAAARAGGRAAAGARRAAVLACAASART